MRRISALIMALLLVLPMLLSCGAETDSKAPPTDNDNSTTASATEPETSKYIDNVPELNYNGAKISFFTRTDISTHEYYVEESNGEIVNDAVYERNLNVQERLNVEFAFDGAKGAYGDRAAFAAKVTDSVLAGGGTYDIVGGYSMSIANLALARMARNLYNNKYIDLDQPWWPSSLISEATVNDYLPFVSGDISLQMIYGMMCVAFNHELIDAYKLEDPYEIVRSGKWTIDKMLSMVKGTYKDLNGDGVKDKDDALGFISGYVWDDAFYWSSGLRTVDKDENGNLVLSDDFTGEKTTDLLTKLMSYFGSSNDVWHVRDDTGILYPFFTEGRTVFLQQSVNVMVQGYRDLPFDYGMIPVPKYDENQKDYITTVSFILSLFMIPTDVSEENTDRAGAVLECLASESYRLVSPALFETALKVKYATDREAGEMYDIMRAGVSFDIGRLFTDSFKEETYSLFRFAFRDGNTNWSSKIASRRSTFEGVLDQINAMYHGK